MGNRECQSGGCPGRLKRFNNTSTKTADLKGSVFCRSRRKIGGSQLQYSEPAIVLIPSRVFV